MLTAGQQSQAEKRLRAMAEDQEAEKNIKNKIKLVSKSLNDLLKEATQQQGKKNCELIAKINEEQLPRFLFELQAKTRHLSDSFQNLRNEKQQLNRERMNAINDKERFNHSIIEIKETISKINKAIQESVTEEEVKRKKIEEDLDKSILEIKQKIVAFERESVELEQENNQLKKKKESIIAKMSGLEGEFKAKAEEKDDAVKKEREELMDKLKQVESYVNLATQLNKQFSVVEKKNFDNKLAIYLRSKKFPQTCNSMEKSATTIDKCKQQLTKGVQRLLKAMQTTKKCDSQSKEINEKCLQKLKIKSQKEDKVKQIKAEKEQVKVRILDLQNQKKQKLEAQNSQ